jgi:hypothetical protein
MKNNSIAFALIGAVCALLFAVVADPPPAQSFKGADAPIYSINSSVVSVGTASTVVAATSSRRYLMIQNDGSTKAYCAFNGRAAYDQSGFTIAASTSWETYSDRLYEGAVACIASSTVRMLVNEAF